jgi:prepilin-type N-terminal cleavage/methylation domain-containing protein
MRRNSPQTGRDHTGLPARRGFAPISLNARRAFSLVELMVAATLMAVLISMAVPSFQRAVNQSRADIAGANLRAIWSAQRCYWLDNRTYSADLSQLESAGLLDPSIAAATTYYIYAIPSADANTFVATATRVDSDNWTGQFSIDETGAVTGTVSASGEPNIYPGFQ